MKNKTDFSYAKSLLQAYEDGKPLEICVNLEWLPYEIDYRVTLEGLNNPRWYRIKPDAIKQKIADLKDGLPAGSIPLGYTTKKKNKLK